MSERFLSIRRSHFSTNQQQSHLAPVNNETPRAKPFPSRFTRIHSIAGWTVTGAPYVRFASEYYGRNSPYACSALAGRKGGLVGKNTGRSANVSCTQHATPGNEGTRWRGGGGDNCRRRKCKSSIYAPGTLAYVRTYARTRTRVHVYARTCIALAYQGMKRER